MAYMCTPHWKTLSILVTGLACRHLASEWYHLYTKHRGIRRASLGFTWTYSGPNQSSSKGLLLVIGSIAAGYLQHVQCHRWCPKKRPSLKINEWHRFSWRCLWLSVANTQCRWAKIQWQRRGNVGNLCAAGYSVILFYVAGVVPG